MSRSVGGRVTPQKNADEAAVVAEAISGDRDVSSTGAARRVPSGEDGGATGLRCLGQVGEEEPSAGQNTSGWQAVMNKRSYRPYQKLRSCPHGLGAV
jgi:hypothetical protein